MEYVGPLHLALLYFDLNLPFGCLFSIFYIYVPFSVFCFFGSFLPFLGVTVFYNAVISTIGLLAIFFVIVLMISLGFIIHNFKLLYSLFKQCYTTTRTEAHNSNFHPSPPFLVLLYFLFWHVNSVTHCYNFYFRQLSFKCIFKCLYIPKYLLFIIFFILLSRSKFPSGTIFLLSEKCSVIALKYSFGPM